MLETFKRLLWKTFDINKKKEYERLATHVIIEEFYDASRKGYKRVLFRKALIDLKDIENLSWLGYNINVFFDKKGEPMVEVTRS